MMIEPVIEIFGKFKGDTILKLRDIIFDDFIKSDNFGMISLKCGHLMRNLIETMLTILLANLMRCIV